MIILVLSTYNQLCFTQKNDTAIQVIINNQQQEKMKLLVGLINPTPSLETIAAIIQNDLACKQQKFSGFNVALRTLTKTPSKKGMKQFFLEGFNIVVFLSLGKDNTIEWRIYDALQTTMQQGKKIKLLKNNEATGHVVADQLWKLLTGQESIFLTKIAYCKSVKKGKQSLKDIYIQSPHSDNAVCFVQGGKLLASRWNKDQYAPLLLYSEVTQANIRLMSVGLDGTRKIVSNSDGLTMLANFSVDGQKVVYCASHKGSCQIYYYYFDQKSKKGINKRLTYNNGNNTSPNICQNGDLIFCSDFETKSPQIYYLTQSTGDIKRLTEGGYCASPHFFEGNKTIAYSKLIGHEMQIFLYNLETKEHKQLTFDKGNKDECSWSPCGNYLAFVVKNGQSGRIAIHNMLTGERFYSTSDQEECSYPTWSCKFADIGIFA